MALDLLADEYSGAGEAIQFHPNTTYENFIGGLAPEESVTQLGLHFAPKPGFLMESAERREEVIPSLICYISTKSIALTWRRFWEKQFTCLKPSLHRTSDRFAL